MPSTGSKARARSRTTAFASLAVVLAGLAAACGGRDGSSSRDGSVLTAVEIEHGIGPVAPFDLGPFEPELAEQGAEVFDLRCSPCHKLGERGIGPDLASVLDRRSPAYVMNMILNPEEMIERHPEARALFAEFKTPMANQHLTETEARAIVEWFRTVDK